MQWKVNLLFVCTILVSTYGQEVLIEDHLNMLNRTTSDSETTLGRANEDDTIEVTSASDNPNADNETGDNENDSGNNPNLDNETGENGNNIGDNSNPGTETDENGSLETTEAPPTPDGNLSSNEETETTTEETVVVRSSEEAGQVPVESNESVSVEDLVTENSVIETTLGPVQGHLWNESPDIISFFDIPYGRFSSFFQPPELPEKWEETHHVASHTKHCPQLHINEETEEAEATEDIDCLTLSVFIPRGARNASVLFHVHDGSFTTGSGDPAIYGPEHLLSKGVILVLPNYRLGPLGFLCLQNETAPGNAALKDLTLALNWTEANIAAFGGNPHNIVVSGDGTSGALAGYLALSPASRDNVYKVITESGSVISHWAIDRDPIATATILAEKIRSLHEEHAFNDTDLFSDIDMQILLSTAQGIHLSPCIEKGPDSFISETPWYILNNEKITKSFMMGSASYAGLHEALSHDENSISHLNEDFGKFMPNDLGFKDDDEKMLEVANDIKTQYFGESVIAANSKELALSYTDAWYLGPVIRAARELVEAGATVYLYEFAFVGDLNRERTALGSEVNGSARGDIVGYLFTQGGQLPEEGSKEEAMVDIMTDLWISFINNGTPSAHDVEWNQLESTSEEEEEWLWIDSQPEARKGCHLDRLQLWTDVYKAHFVERNLCYSLTRNPALIVAAIALVGLFPKTMQSR